MANEVRVFSNNQINDITGVSPGLLKSLGLKFSTVLKEKGLVHIMDIINRSLPKSTFYNRNLRGGDYDKLHLRSRYRNIKDTFYNFAFSDIAIDGIYIMRLVFLDHHNSTIVINKIQSLLEALEDSHTDESKTILAISVIIGVLGICHPYPDGNGRVFLSLVKIFINHFAKKEIDLDLINSRNSDFCVEMTRIYLSMLPQRWHPKVGLLGEKNYVCNYELIAKDDTNFFTDFGANLTGLLDDTIASLDNKEGILQEFMTDQENSFTLLSNFFLEAIIKT